MLPPPPATCKPPGSPHDALRLVRRGPACASVSRRGPGLRWPLPGDVGALPSMAAGKVAGGPGGRRSACGSRSKAVRAKAPGSGEAEAERALGLGPGRRRWRRPGLPGGESWVLSKGRSGSRLSAERRRGRNGGASSARASRLPWHRSGPVGSTSCASVARSSPEPQRGKKVGGSGIAAHTSASSWEERLVAGTWKNQMGLNLKLSLGLRPLPPHTPMWGGPHLQVLHPALLQRAQRVELGQASFCSRELILGHPVQGHQVAAIAVVR